VLQGGLDVVVRGAMDLFGLLPHHGHGGEPVVTLVGDASSSCGNGWLGGVRTAHRERRSPAQAGAI